VGEAQSLVYIYVYLSQATLVYCDNVSAIVFKASSKQRLRVGACQELEASGSP
jgi:hypothetical protein